ncbi:MAG: PA14 domain-containing protein, partial [Planctomycetota bacterium]
MRYKKLIYFTSLVFVLFLFLSSTAHAWAFFNDLLVWYKFDETSGIIVYDSSNYGNDGVLVGDPTWTAEGMHGGALDFDGAGDYVEDEDGENYLNGQTALTVCVWVKSRQINTDRGFLIALQPLGGDRSVTMRYDAQGAFFGGTNLLKMAVSSSHMPGADGQQLESSSGLQTTDWQHYSMTWESGGIIRFYINAVEDTPTGRISPNLGGTLSECTTFIVGRGGKDVHAAAEGWDGLIDDVLIFKRALSRDEIEIIMWGYPPPPPPRPDPPDGAVDVPVDANLSWRRGYGIVQEEVYFGTDPYALPLVDIILNMPPLPPTWNPPGDLIASTTYYWQIVEVNGPDRYEGPVWKFTTIRGEAQCDYPYDGALIAGDTTTYNGEDYIWTKLNFFPGATATKHTGYFNEDYSKVESRVQDANIGEPPYAHISGWEYTFFAGNPQVPPADDSLVRGHRYYWTVDAEDALGNVFAGDVWEFTIQDFKAGCPDPPNEATFVETDVLLSWCPGFGVEEYDVYLGTDLNGVELAEFDLIFPPPEYKGTTKEPNIFVTGLAYNTKYYWRVDGVIGRVPPFFIPTALYKGDVWCFTTIAEGVGSIRMDLWWDIPIILPCIYPYPPYPYEPFETKFLTSFNSGTQLADGYVGMIHGWLHPQKSGDYRFWICSDDNSELHLSTDESPSNAKLIAKESTWTPPFTWNNDENMSDLIPLVGGRKYYINAVWREGGGGDHCMVAWRGPDQPLKPVDGQDFAIIPGNRLSPYAQKWAHDPDPRDWQHAVPTTYTLEWGPGDHADRHDVYISTDKALVDARDASTFKGRFDPNFYGPVDLATGQLYYWAIDEVNNLGPPPGIWKGPTWMFRAAGAAGGLLGLYYHWDPATLPPVPAFPPYPGPPNPFQVFVMSRLDPEINFNWGSGSPHPDINKDYFACKWIGYVECPVDANYTFYTTSDEGARLFIDGVPILPVDAWHHQVMGEWSTSVELTAGLHDIEMHHYESLGDAAAWLLWSAIPTNPSDDAIPKQIIPPIWLWPPLFASGPRPLDGSTINDRKPTLEWIPGLYAATHEFYFSANYDDVNDRNPANKEVLSDPCRPYPAGPRLELGRTYYWCVDEVNSASEKWNARSVREFTISDCLSIDNMEDYNDRNDIRVVWRDGSADVDWAGIYPFLYLVQGGSSGSNLNVSTAVGSPVQGATGPIPPTPLNYQAMVLRYDNDGWTYIGLPGEEKWIYDAPYYSEIEANTVGENSLDVGRTWESDGVKSLSLWFQGHPISDGDYDANGWPAYTVSGRGRDIGGRHDEFYFLGQYPFVGHGSIQVQVLSMDNTNPWAKAGVMIREKWTPYSKYAAVFMTPGHGVTFQYRDVEDGLTNSITKPGVSLPEYVRLERTISGMFEAYHSDNGFVWEHIDAPDVIWIFPPIDDPNIYVGSAVTSHNANQVCSADFNNMLISPLPPKWIFGNIGTNDPEQLYVALYDGIHTTVVNHPDPNAATLTDWQEWNIPLTDFTDINLDSIEKVYIGLGDRDKFVPGGSGAIYVDDIRACPPRCVPALAKPLADIAQPYDCIVDEKDLGALAGDWLMFDELIVTSAPSDVNLTARYEFENNFLDSGVHANHLTDPCGTIPGFDTGVIGSFALSLDGV